MLGISLPGYALFTVGFMALASSTLAWSNYAIHVIMSGGYTTQAVALMATGGMAALAVGVTGLVSAFLGTTLIIANGVGQ